MALSSFCMVLISSVRFGLSNGILEPPLNPVLFGDTQKVMRHRMEEPGRFSDQSPPSVPPQVSLSVPGRGPETTPRGVARGLTCRGRGLTKFRRTLVVPLDAPRALPLPLRGTRQQRPEGDSGGSDWKCLEIYGAGGFDFLRTARFTRSNPSYPSCNSASNCRVDPSSVSGIAASAASHGASATARSLPSSTPHWSKELMPSSTPSTKTRCS